MASKKKKKESGEPAYTMITLEAVKARELKYTQRIEALRACLSYLDDMLTELEVLNEEHRLLEKWETYLRCDGLPKPYIPPDIRVFFEKMRYFEAETIEKNIDWTLSVDDKSILTQNIFRIDRTRPSVKRDKLPNLGAEYNKNINLALQVLKSIEYYLADVKMHTQAKPRILQDIKEQKQAVHHEIHAFMDRYAYRILCSEDAYMDDIDARTTEYFYKGTNFGMHIWAVKNVPIIFEFLEEPYMIAKLHCLKAEIFLPLSTLEDNLTIRGCHFDFDPYSEGAKSFEQVIPIPIEDLNAGITDLRECLLSEWKMQVDIQIEIREEMVQRRLEYEEKKRQFEEEEAQRAKEKKNASGDEKKKKQKPLKLPKEPPKVAENEVPDIWRDFLKREQQEFEDFLNLIYHPDVLNLQSNEVNLKKYLLLGGIYKFDFVSKARHLDFTFNAFNMTWHENDGKLLLKSDKNIKLPVTLHSIVSARASESKSGRKPERISFESVYDELESPWFVVKLELPEYLCLWGSPVPCHFEANVIGYIEEEVPDAVVTPKSKKSRSTLMTVPTIATSTAASTMQPSVQHVEVTKDISVGSFMISGSSYSLQHGNYTISPIPSSWDVLSPGIDDFDLSFPLTKAQIRNLQRHCIPRIISSYKFPSELSAEDKERKAKAKTAGGTLVRRHSSAVDDVSHDAAERAFSVALQHEPERLFAVFDSPDLLKIRQRSITGDLMHDDSHRIPRTFQDFIKKLDTIKRYYLGRVQRTMGLPPFKPKWRVKGASKKKTTTQEALPGTQSLDRMRRSARSMGSHASTGSVRRKDSTDRSRKSELDKMLERQSEAGVDADEEEAGEGGAKETGSSSSTLAPQTPVDNRKTYTYSRWTTKHIKHTEFDRQKRVLTIWTDRLGTIGLAYKRYEHFPFRYWSLQPNEENPENEVTFTLETQFVKVVLYVSGDGVRGYVTDLQKKFVRNRPMYLIIEEPLKDFREFRKRFREKNLNIFTERDASFYIENGYFSQKHLATELHTYCCMCSHASLMRFFYSDWNRLSSRRNMLLNMLHHKESEEYMCTVRITPEEATFVTVKELCSDDLNVFNLEYTLTWRNIDFYADLHHLITSMYPSAPEQRIKNPHFIYFLKALLWEIRPLSFS